MGEKNIRTAPVSSSDRKLSSKMQKHSSFATAMRIGGRSRLEKSIGDFVPNDDVNDSKQNTLKSPLPMFLICVNLSM